MKQLLHSSIRMDNKNNNQFSQFRKPMKTLFNFCFIIFLSALTSCKKDKDNSAQVLMPLKVGNEWQHEIVTYDDNGGVVGSEFVTSRILKDTVINGETYFWNGTVYYRNADLNTVMQSLDAKEFYVIFKRSNVDKATFEILSRMAGNCQLKQVITAFTQVTNENGYKSLRNETELISCNNVLHKIVTYFAPGTGMVKYLIYVPVFNGGMVLRHKGELKSYKLN